MRSSWERALLAGLSPHDAGAPGVHETGPSSSLNVTGPITVANTLFADGIAGKLIRAADGIPHPIGQSYPASQ